jgi:hypothetical protein
VIEFVMAWICLVIGAFAGNPIYLIASGVYAVAAQIERLREGGVLK